MQRLAAHHLEAFHAIADAGSFSAAAKRLRLSQPALSYRIAQLETQLGKRVFHRARRGATLTEAGARVLRHCQVLRGLEVELLSDLGLEAGRAAEGTLSGSVRIGAFSSVARSCVMPALEDLARENPRLMFDFVVREMTELTRALLDGSLDFALLDHGIERPDLEHERLGAEELVLVESTRYATRAEVYLDHDPEDRTTLQFLRRNGVRARYVTRSFFDDVYGVLDGAARGYGRAVVPRHLLSGRDLRVVFAMRPKPSPVVLHYYRKGHDVRVHEAVHAALRAGVPRWLSQRAEDG